ncbi:hypothetical protein [Herbaspirillum sp.]|uniref:hypothetical protein n=1 Tax=Herbaspirillum sp. TaxID=1890675 RepID=UPI0031D9B356
MATISKRGPYQYQAPICRQGYPFQTNAFETRVAAEAWARGIETAMRQNLFQDSRSISDITLGDALQTYLEEVISTKNRNTRQRERNRIKLL